MDAPQPKRFEKLFVTLAPYIIAAAAVMLIFLMFGLNKTNVRVQETSAYTRVSNCIVAKVANPPTTQEDVEKCYTQVEKATDVKLERFDEQTHNEN